MGEARYDVASSRDRVRGALSDARRRTGEVASGVARRGGGASVLALQRRAGNSAVSALVAAKLKAPGEAATAALDAGLRELRGDEPALEPVEKALRTAKDAGVPVDLEGPKPPPAALEVRITGFGPESVPQKKAPPPTKPVPAKSPLAKAAQSPGKQPARGPGGSPPAAKAATGADGAATAAPALGPDALLQPPVAPTGVRPEEDPGFRAVSGGLRAVGQAKKAHPPAAAKAAEAQDAAAAPGDDREAQAKAAKADSMDAQQPGGFDKKAFIAAVKAAIEAKSPRTLKEADSYKESGKAAEVKGEVHGLVSQGKQGQAKDIEAATEAPPDESKAVPKQVTPLQVEQPGGVPQVPAAGAVPKPAPPEQLNLAAGKHQAEQELADAEVTEPQLEQSGEPDFQQAVTDKRAAAAHADTAPGDFRQQEQQVLQQQSGEAQTEAKAGIAGMHGSKAAALAGLVADKAKTKSKDEARRAEVTTKIQGIFNATETEVKQLLDGIDPKVEAAFTAGEAKARAEFEGFVSAKMSAYKKDRYGGWLGGLRWAKDKLLGMPAKVNEFYEAGRELYLKRMDGVITQVAGIVGDDLSAAKRRIAKGRTEIADYVKTLPKDLQKVGAEASTEIGERFSALEEEVQSKQDSVVDALASKYVEARKGLDERIEALQAENKGLVDKAIGAIKAVINTIRELAAMLRNVLSRVAGVVGQIIKNPVDFLGNLIAGIKGGILKFKDNILDHLRKGLMGWLFGALAEGGVELPETFDVKGVVKLLASLFGLTWRTIRNRIVKQIGEKAMGAVESGVSVFQTLAGQGIGGLWELLLEKLGDIKEMILDQVKDFVVTKVITAGITWLIGLLNPAAAFIKACKLIYDVVMFFVTNASRIADFVNTVIDSVADVVRGNVSGVVDKIENVLGKMVPIIIGFLASVIGLGGIGEKVRKIVETLQKPFTKAIDAVVTTGLKLAAPLIRGLKGIGAKVKAKVSGAGQTAAQKKQRLDAGMTAARRAGERFKGKVVGKAVLSPLMAAIRVRYRLTSLELVEKGTRWAVRGTVNPTAEELLEAELVDPKYDTQFQEAVEKANIKLAANKPPRSIGPADLAEAKRVVAPTGRRAKGSLNQWINDLYTYFRDPSPEPRDTVVTVDAHAANPHLRLVGNRSQRFTRLEVQTIDTAQKELNEHYRPGASLGDRSSAYLVVAEQLRGGRGNAPVAIVEGTTHYDKCKRAVQLFRRLEPGLPQPQRDVVSRERSKMEVALTWAISYRDPGQPVRPLPPFASDLDLP